MGKIFYFADPHIGHANIIRHSKRPFVSVEEMNDFILKNWNSVVGKDDHVYVLGDMFFKLRDVEIENYLKKLNGHIHLIIGNHDKEILKQKYSKYFESKDDYLKINDNGTEVVLFHYPIAEWDGYYRNAIHLFGHIHNNENEAYHTMKERKNCYNVGADILGFTPRTLKEIIKGDFEWN